MKKIPFEATFVGAYKFLFQRILSVIGTAWLPILVFAALAAGLVYLTVPHSWWQGQFPVFDEKHPDPWAMWAIIQPLLGAYLAVILLLTITSAMLTVGMMRLALGQKQRCFVFFSLGADVWRMLANWILVMLLFWLIYLLMAIAVIIGIVVLKPHVPEAVGILLLVLAGIFCFGFVIFAMVRLCFFLPAVAVAEHRISLGRSWELGKGNFWRMAGLVLLVWIPVGVVAQVLQQIVITVPMLANIVRLSEHPVSNPAALFQIMAPAMGGFAVVLILEIVVLQALFAALAALSYKAVTAPEEVQS